MVSEIRDRGLLSYHLNEFQPALRDLEEYLRMNTWKGDVDQEERDQILDHVKTLKRRVSSMN
jgi:regulator of sirC expression with transglutaminase-like and TPR domain